MIMNKFQKRISKTTKNHGSALVIGSGLGHLEEILEVFRIVFVIADVAPNIKARNLTFRENFDDLNPITDIDAIFFDLDHIKYLENVSSIWHKYPAPILIEGNDVIEREFSKPLYKHNYRAVDQQGIYHVWKII